MQSRVTTVLLAVIAVLLVLNLIQPFILGKAVWAKEMRGKPIPRYTEPYRLTDASGSIDNLAVADVDRDGYMDIVYSDGNWIYVMFGVPPVRQ